MKKVNMETKWEVLKEIAKENNLKYVGVKKDTLVAQINELKPKKGGKWYDEEGAFPFAEGSLAIITSHKNKAIVGRMVQVFGPSTKRNALKGYMVNPKTGALQNTFLSLDFDMVTEYQPQYPVVVPQASLILA